MTFMTTDDLSRPADILVPLWTLGKSAAFDITIVSPLKPSLLIGAGDKSAIQEAEDKKHAENDAKCSDLGWLCIPLAANTYGEWGEEAHKAFSSVALQLSVRTSVSFSIALSSLYNTLGVVLARQNARAILARRSHPLPIGARELRQAASLPLSSPFSLDS